jgi:hypothetical protein
MEVRSKKNIWSPDSYLLIYLPFDWKILHDLFASQIRQFFKFFADSEHFSDNVVPTKKDILGLIAGSAMKYFVVEN